jgi:hypothetical protein
MSQLASVFAALREIIKPYAATLETTTDTDTELSVNTRHVQENGKPLFFGAVLVKKNFISYHLMPVYVEPKLLNDVSPALRTRMQGKSCFNFTNVDPGLFQELSDLTRAAFEHYQEQGFA